MAVVHFSRKWCASASKALTESGWDNSPKLWWERIWGAARDDGARRGGSAGERGAGDAATLGSAVALAAGKAAQHGQRCYHQSCHLVGKRRVVTFQDYKQT